MAEHPMMPFWTDAYLGDTGHLTTLEHGAYLLLLITMWRNKGVLPNDDKMLARYARMTQAQWKRVKPVMMEFFEVKDGYLYQSRLNDEYNAVRQLRKKQSKNAKARWLKNNKDKNATAQSGTSMAYTSPNPSPIAAKAATREETGNLAASVHARICEIAGKDPTRDFRWADWHVVQQWLNEGYDPDRDIYPVIQRRMANGATPKSPAYFTDAIREAAAKASAKAETGTGIPAPIDEDAQRRVRLKALINDGTWLGQWGDEPTVDEAKAELASLEDEDRKRAAG